MCRSHFIFEPGGRSTAYTYDPNGNALTETLDANTTTYTYDAKNKLVSVVQDGVTTSYTYNPDGVRDSKTEGGVATSIIVDSNRDYAQVLLEDDGTNQVIYTYGDDLLNQSRDGTTSFFHYDGLGSTRSLSDSSGILTDTYNYEAFGELLNLTGTTDNDYLFAGEQLDANLEQYYLRARYYDQGIGRFTQQDTWMGNSSDPVTLHKYLYANADPVMYTDPTGKFGLSSLSVGSAINGVLLTANIGFTSYSIFDVAMSDDSVGVKSSKIGALILLAGVGGSYSKIIASKLGVTVGQLTSRVGVWALPATQRGVQIERKLASTTYAGWFNVGQLNRGFFPLVDFQLGKTLVSLKTIDPLSKTNRIPGMIKHINELARGHKVSGQAAKIVLDIRVPAGTEGLLKALVNYGKDKGVRVKISAFL